MTPSSLLIAANRAHLAGFTAFAAALVELYRRELRACSPSSPIPNPPPK